MFGSFIVAARILGRPFFVKKHVHFHSLPERIILAALHAPPCEQFE
jgi:hypothetical protein